MAFTEHYAILNDCPLFWDPDLLRRGVHAVRFHPDLPTRIGVIPRRGTNADIRWFEAAPTYVLHWINAYEDGDEIVLDGFFQVDPAPTDAAGRDRGRAAVPLPRQQRACSPSRTAGASTWRPARRKEEFLDDRTTEFGMINARHRAVRTATCTR